MDSAVNGSDYVRVSWDDGCVILTVPRDADPGAFLQGLPWLFADPGLRAFHHNPWRRASLFAGGRLIDEIFFIADA
jgi:hypothetical protein